MVKTAGTARVYGVDIDARPRRARRVIGEADLEELLLRLTRLPAAT